MGPFTALVCLLLSSPPPPATEWVRVETANLIVFGPGEKRTREVTAEFERFREAIGHVLSGASVASAVPTIVVVFENDAAFSPYRPLYNGKPIKLGGFYTGTENDNMIAFPLGDRDNSLRIIFHEYSHLITANATRGLSPWVSEGLAEFYSTFEIRPDGKQALLGRVVPGHLELLNRTSKWLTLDELLNVRRDSPLYNEGERRSLFYAQSWALVHMFLTGEPDRSKQLTEYVDLTSGGMAPLEAWERAFGFVDVEKELRRYVTKYTLRGFLYRFPEGIGTLKAESMKPKPTDVDAVLSRLLRFRDEEQVEPQLVRAANAAPESLLARALLGHRYVQGNNDQEGVRLLIAAAADASDWLTQYYVASGIAWETASPRGEARQVALSAADRVIAARPQLAHGYALKSRLAEGTEAVALAQKARTLAPGREDYTFLEAQLRAENGDYAAARSTLAPLLTPIYRVEVRDRARSLMGQIVRAEAFNAKRGGPPPGTRADRTDADSSAGSRPPGDAGTPSPSPLWVFREVKPGEQRIEGTLERIDCTRTGAVTLVVRSGSEVKRFAAPQFSDVDFITYRELQGGSIACGERKTPEGVYVTWVPLASAAAGVAGRPVAVEFLPEKR